MKDTIIFLAILAVILLIAMAFSVLSLAIAGAMFFSLGFWEAWHMAWDQPFRLVLWIILTNIVTFGVRESSK